MAAPHDKRLIVGRAARRVVTLRSAAALRAHRPSEGTYSKGPAGDARFWLGYRRSLEGGFAVFLYAAVVLWIAYPIFSHLSDGISGSGVGDEYYSAWFLWWFKHAMDAGLDPAHCTTIFSLLPSVQVFADPFFDGALAWPMQWFITPLAAYNLLVLLTFVFTGFTMYVLAGEFVRSWVARFAAGFLYTFSTYHFARAGGHLNLFSIEWIPFCAWRLFVFYRRPNALNAALAGLGLALVPLSEVYFLPYFALPFVALFVGSKLVTDWRWFTVRRNLTLSALALFLALAIVGPLLAPGYLRIDPDVRAMSAAAGQRDVDTYSADLLAFFLPNNGNPFYSQLTWDIYTKMNSGGVPEEAVFLGYPTLLLGLGAFAFRRNRNPTTLLWLLVAVTGFVLALGPTLYVAGHAVMPLPTYNVVFGWSALSTFRTPNRLGILPITALSVLAAFAIDAVFAILGQRSSARIGGAAVVALLLAFSLRTQILVAMPLPSTPVHLSSIYRIIGADKGSGRLLELPLAFTGSYQFNQTVHHKPIVTGYAPRVTPRMFDSVDSVPYLSQFDAYSDVGGTPQGAEGDIYPVNVSFKRGLQENRIRYVILHHDAAPTNYYGWMRAFLKANLGKPFYDNAVEGVTSWRLPSGPGPDRRSYHFSLAGGWVHGIEIQNQHLERVMDQDAQIVIDAPRPARRRLEFTARTLYRPLTMDVRFNGTTVKTLQFNSTSGEQLVNLGALPLHAGRNVLEIHSVQGCSTGQPFDVKNPDVSCVSIGIQQVRLAHLHETSPGYTIFMEKGPAIVLQTLYPGAVRAGQTFNYQPTSGQSALAVQLDETLPGMVIVFHGHPLDTVYNPSSSHFLTALIPGNLVSQPGQYPVYVKYGQRESNWLTFTVSP